MGGREGGREGRRARGRRWQSGRMDHEPTGQEPTEHDKSAVISTHVAAPPERVWAWRWLGEDRDSRVTISLTARDGGTDLVVVHDRIDAATAEMYRAGWETCLARLPAHLG
ncbi:SRPBCC domain-containing protein [Paractinoplanes rhizophilus]|uniref:SRPBCC domain-containing protein n=1 Tax=Paractinoplanes rhizophilus TaxID=1416877 RepID=A0ABW2HTM1_9ACTN